MKTPQPVPPGSPAFTGITEVRYSLPELLREVKLERDAAAFASTLMSSVAI